MSRGWESKDVEARQAQAAIEWRERQSAQPKALDLARVRERESLELTITRVESDLGRATHPRHRLQLQAAVAHLNAELAKLQ